MSEIIMLLFTGVSCVIALISLFDKSKHREYDQLIHKIDELAKTLNAQNASLHSFDVRLTLVEYRQLGLDPEKLTKKGVLDE